MMLRKLRAPVAAATLAAFVAAGTAVAQTPMPDPLDAHDAKRLDRMEKVVRELRAIVFQLKETGKPVVVETADTDARLQDLATKLGDLEQSLTRVNASLETTAHQLDETRRANADLQAQVKSLNERLASVEQKAAQAAPPPPEAAAAPAPQNQASPADAFAQARQLMFSGDYDGAQAAFADYIHAYPDAPNAAEARYWWGKTLSVKGAHAQAATAYIGAIRGWPKTRWAPDAVVELARSLVALKKPTDACETLAELKRRYPKAPAEVTSRAQATRAQAKCA